tara:strand:- start:301 stop:951 length:651 start_codon:yes stop_codon:yes gene_type:complete
MLKIESINVSIQSVNILRNFSLNINSGETTGLIGRNGSGKTTTLRTIMGHLKAETGLIKFEEKNLLDFPAHFRPNLGIGYMPEGRDLVPELTVEENILVPLWATKKNDIQKRIEFVYNTIPELSQMKDRRSLLLSGGQQKLVALGRALAIGNKLLLLDEPFEGVAPALSERLSDVMLTLRKSKISILIAQSDLNHSKKLIDSKILIERGSNIMKKI